MNDERDRAARAALSAVVEPGSVKIAEYVLAHGAEAVWRRVASGDATLDGNGVLAKRARGVTGADVLKRADEFGIRYVCPGDPEWPDALDVLPATLAAGAEPVPPPFGLWIRGAASLAGCVAQAVAVVGSRAASSYGSRVAADLGSDLAMLGWTVVSGAAYGIDVAAHRGALAVGGMTVAVLACGLDIAYPRAHGELLARIASTGLVAGELPPGMAPMRSRFLARNRIIAGLAAGTVVVEAARRSGALSTAQWTEKVGRPVMAVPGPVTSELSTGCHEWIRNRGATLVADAQEVADAAGALGTDAAPLRSGEERPLDRFDFDVRQVYERLPAFEVTTVVELAKETGYQTGFLEHALSRLAEAGLVTARLDGWARAPGAA